MREPGTTAAAFGLVALAMALAAQSGAAGPATAGGAEERIVFSRSCGTGCADIFSVGADGRNLRRLTSDRRSYDPVWSPDKRRIAFASERGDRAGRPSST